MEQYDSSKRWYPHTNPRHNQIEFFLENSSNIKFNEYQHTSFYVKTGGRPDRTTRRHGEVIAQIYTTFSRESSNTIRLSVRWWQTINYWARIVKCLMETGTKHIYQQKHSLRVYNYQQYDSAKHKSHIKQIWAEDYCTRQRWGEHWKL